MDGTKLLDLSRLDDAIDQVEVVSQGYSDEHYDEIITQLNRLREAIDKLTELVQPVPSTYSVDLENV